VNQINRLVGERVFGWAVRESEDGEAPSWATPMSNHLERQYHACPIMHGPNFSKEIAAAWEVRAAMKQRGFWLLLIDMNDGTWHAAFKSVEPDGRCIYSSECVAICLAALRAVGVSESEIQEAMR
jgi:hypothetical protein